VVERDTIKKQTSKRLHHYCHRGEKRDNLVNRLIDACEAENCSINLSDETVQRLLDFTGCSSVDEALNLLMNKCRRLKKG
jgi:hypothetical protein